MVVAMAVMLCLAPTPADAGQRGAAIRRATSAISRSMKARLLRIARLDRAAHRRAATRVLQAPRSVYRYVTSSRAAREVRSGFGRMTHFTSRAGRGRPLSGAAAQQKYGLAQKPAQRLRVTLPTGTPIKAAKVHGGGPGVGEVVTTKALAPAKAGIRAVKIK